MKTRKFLALLLALSMLLSLAACGGEQVPTDIPNGDFEAEHEMGKWTGWTREDAAFNVRGLVSDEKISGAVMEKSGEFYFAGSEGGNPTMRGTLTSDPFNLGGNGFITFKMGTGDEWLSVWTNGDNLQKYRWNHVAATFDAEMGEMYLYLNGELVASRSVPAGAEIAHAKNRTLLIGRNGEGERLTAGFLNTVSGYLDEVKLYDCALPGEEIAAAYEKVKVPEIEFEQIWLQNVLTGDYTRTQFHGGPYQFWMNEPHGYLC